MADKHLNLFYAYNRDNELIENNLTRAFIVSLRLLSPQSRNFLLTFLLQPEYARLRPHPPTELPSFANASFALQGYISKETVRKFPQRYIITIATDRYEEKNEEVVTYDNPIPDAWIFDETVGYCFLVEAKVGQNPLDHNQLYSHAKDWLGLKTSAEVERRIISVTWINVLQAIDRLRSEVDLVKLGLNEQERLILEALEEYLNFFNYRLFRGFHFNRLQERPNLELFEIKTLLPVFSALSQPPHFQLTSPNSLGFI